MYPSYLPQSLQPGLTIIGTCPICKEYNSSSLGYFQGDIKEVKLTCKSQCKSTKNPSKCAEFMPHSCLFYECVFNINTASFYSDPNDRESEVLTIENVDPVTCNTVTYYPKSPALTYTSLTLSVQAIPKDEDSSSEDSVTEGDVPDSPQAPPPGPLTSGSKSDRGKDRGEDTDSSSKSNCKCIVVGVSGVVLVVVGVGVCVAVSVPGGVIIAVVGGLMILGTVVKYLHSRFSKKKKD